MNVTIYFTGAVGPGGVSSMTAKITFNGPYLVADVASTTYWINNNIVAYIQSI